MDLKKFFSAKQIIQLEGTEKQHVFKEMLEKLQNLNLIQNKERYYAQIVHRESLENTGIGNGFAIPHARTDTVDDLIAILGVVKSEIEYQSIDNKPVKYILLSLIPSKLSTQYLYLIGMMARIFSNPEKKKLLDQEGDIAKLYKLLTNESKSYYAAISDTDNTEFNCDDDSLQGIPSSDLDLIIRLDRLYQLADDSTSNKQLDLKIEELKKLIDNRPLTYYERMRKKNNNPFSIVEKNSCTGCNMGIPPIYLKQIKDREGIPVCTHCGRFLIVV